MALENIMGALLRPKQVIARLGPFLFSLWNVQWQLLEDRPFKFMQNLVQSPLMMPHDLKTDTHNHCGVRRKNLKNKRDASSKAWQSRPKKTRGASHEFFQLHAFIGCFTCGETDMEALQLNSSASPKRSLPV